MSDYPEEPPIHPRTGTARSLAGEEALTRRRLRADALHNRHALVAVAVSMLSRSDEEVSLEAIAREAGVGIGTLYRHFPTREALVVEAYGDEIDQLCTAVTGLLGTLPPTWLCGSGCSGSSTTWRPSEAWPKPSGRWSTAAQAGSPIPATSSSPPSMRY